MTARLVASEPLPVRGHPNVRAAAIGGALHVLATKHDGFSAAHLVVDAKAHGDRLPDLPFAVVEMAGRDDELLVTAEERGGAVFLAVVDANGHERWRIDLPVDTERVTRPPLPLTSDERIVVVWEELDGDDRVLSTVAIRDQRRDPPERTKLPGVTHALDFVFVPAGLVRARLAGFPPQLTLTGPTTQPGLPEVTAGPLALARANGVIRLVWADERRLLERSFDSSLEPLGKTSMLGSIPAGRIDRIRGYGQERAAFVATTSIGKTGDRSRTSATSVQGYLLMNGSLLAVPLPVGWIEAGGWIGDQFILVHGDGQMNASVFSS